MFVILDHGWNRHAVGDTFEDALNRYEIDYDEKPDLTNPDVDVISGELMNVTAKYTVTPKNPKPVAKATVKKPVTKK